MDDENSMFPSGHFQEEFVLCTKILIYAQFYGVFGEKFSNACKKMILFTKTKHLCTKRKIRQKTPKFADCPRLHTA